MVGATVAGCDAVLSALGGLRDTDSIRIGTALVAEAMREQRIRRLVVVQGFHLAFPGDPRSLGRVMVLPLLWLGSRSLIADSRTMARELASSRVDWTLVRVPRVTEGGPTGRRRIGQLRLGPWSSVANGDVAEAILGCLADPATIGAAPMVSGRPRPRRHRSPQSHTVGPSNQPVIRPDGQERIDEGEESNA
jgi:hypothetical protein